MMTKNQAMKLMQVIRLERAEIKLLIFYSLSIGVFSLTIPIGVQSLVNSVAFGTVLQPIFVLSALVFLGMSISGVFRVIQRSIAEYIALRVGSRLTFRLVDQLVEMDEELENGIAGPSRINRFLEFFDIQKTLIFLLIDGFESLLILVLGLALMAFYHPLLLVFAIGLILSVVLMMKFTLAVGAESSLDASTAKYDLASWMVQLSESVREFKSNRGSEFARGLAEKKFHHYLVSRRRFFKVLISQLIGTWMIYICSSTLLLAIGGYLVFKSQLSLGQLVAAELVLAGVLSSLLKLAKVFEAYFDGYASMHKIDDLLSIEVERKPESSATFDSIEGVRIDLRGIQYEVRNTQIIFSNLSLSISAGQTVFVVGPSGSGKTTLIEMIYGLYPPKSGKIEINGIDFAHINRMDFRDSVAWVSRFESYGGTIRENLLLGQVIDTARIIEVLKTCQVWSVIQSFELGLDTAMETREELPLSEGQLAKLSIARAILQNPKLVLIDEVLDAIDLKKRKLVLKGLRTELKGATFIIATHDQSYIESDDIILDLASERFS